MQCNATPDFSFIIGNTGMTEQEYNHTRFTLVCMICQNHNRLMWMFFSSSFLPMTVSLCVCQRPFDKSVKTLKRDYWAKVLWILSNLIRVCGKMTNQKTDDQAYRNCEINSRKKCDKCCLSVWITGALGKLSFITTKHLKTNEVIIQRQYATSWLNLVHRAEEHKI